MVIVLNGAAHLSQLRAVVAAARGDDRAYVVERVTLDDGESLGEVALPEGDTAHFVAELRIPAPEPVADYVRSMSGTTHHAHPALVAKVLSTFPRASDGHFVITSHSGCLICEAD